MDTRKRPVRILPLGDSITMGLGSPGGYREYLYQNLTSMGYNVVFVGNEDNNPAVMKEENRYNTSSSRAANHEGHSNWEIDHIASNIELWFTFMVHPDIILLHVGTNDFGYNHNISGAIDRLERLIGMICKLKPNSHLIVTNLLEREEPTNNNVQTQFNPFVEERVQRQNSKCSVSFLDMRSFVPLDDMPDKLHPNAVGYEKMALAWSSSIIHVIGPLNTSEVLEPLHLKNVETTPKNTLMKWVALILFFVGVAAYNLPYLNKKKRTKRSIRVIGVYVLLSILLWNSTSSRVSSQFKDMISSPSKANHTMEDAFKEWIEQEQETFHSRVVRSIERIPPWMKKYLAWHREKRRLLLEETNITKSIDTKYLVVRCLKNEVCGRLTDRLKPMPFYLMVANLTNRVLLIHWEEPTLEHFVVPPKYGLDWRIEGTVTLDEIQNNTNHHNGNGKLSDEIRKITGEESGGERFVHTRVISMKLDIGTKPPYPELESPTIIGARDLFNQWNTDGTQSQEKPWDDAYTGWSKNSTVTNDNHDLFTDVLHIMFQPSAAVQTENYYHDTNYTPFSSKYAWYW